MFSVGLREHCSHFSRIMHIPNSNIFLLIFISIAINHVIGDETNSFWLSADLLSVEWRKGCLTTAGCADPRFNIIESNMASNERISVSWPVTQDIVQDHSRSFVSHWTGGSPRDIKISCEVAGVDPTYGFPRVCDATSSVRIFRKTPENKIASSRSRRSDVATLRSEAAEGRMVVELKGKCYNATLAIAKHELRCPWCPEHSDIAIVEQYLEADSSPEFLRQFGGRDQFLYMALIFLSAISAILSASFACLLIAFLRQKRNSKIMANKHRLYHEQSNHIVHPLREPDAEDNRYEVPWEQSQQYHPFPYYHVGNRSDITISSPLDSSSIIAGSISDHTPLTKTAFTNTKRFSPNSSVGERRDDSGLESV
uniref:C2 domain-containing protein n=2 Tax=Parascaris univalens TaxID=6257 RepID=A0A915AHY2_PARUN